MLSEEDGRHINFNTLRQEGILLDIHQRMEFLRGEFCEKDSWKLLELLQKEMLKLSDKCFTTSQRGSGTSTERTKKDPKYDSIYYLFELSNNTYLCQRLKRNTITKDGLEHVIQPIAGLSLFVKGNGLNIKAGSYPFDQISSKPQLGQTLYEYFP